MSKFNFTLHHTSMIVADVETSLKFYCGVLDLLQVERPKLPYSGAWFQLGEQQLHLLELENPDPTIGRPDHGGRDRHVALNVTSIAPVQDALKRANIPFSMSKSGRQALFCRDPDGNAIEILERG
jgi:glyoxylase I family protein